MYHYNKNLNPIAQSLRKEMTPEEKKIWYQFLKKLPVTVYRQRIVGNYIADFYIANKKLIIEIDGLQHQMPDNREADEKRDRYFSEMGLTVKRYHNKDINRNFIAVCEDLLKTLELTADQMKK